jgi:hypothetical protein
MPRPQASQKSNIAKKEFFNKIAPYPSFNSILHATYGT